MNRFVPIVALLLVGCSRAQGAAWTPRLVVRGAVVQRAASRSSGSERWSWRLQGDLRWGLDRPPPAPVRPATPKVTTAASGAGELACLDANICAWERRARARALAFMSGGNP